MLFAQTSGAMVVEVGGWVLSEQMRGTAEAVRLALGVWAWGRLLGGAIGIATATTRNHSAHILGRIGGRPLEYRGEVIPKYFEPKYGCDIQIMRFKSDSYSDRFAPIVDSMTAELIQSTVLSAGKPAGRFTPALGAGLHIPPAELAFAGLAN